jgi:SAM-dependent methyltransferase
VDDCEHAVRTLGLRNVRAENQDARDLPYPDASFDLITSISVLEHIAPEVRGEAPVVREVCRLLRPGGIAVITVPFATEYFAEYRIGQVYERESTNQEPIFFQRFYDYDRLMKYLVGESALNLLELGFIDERFFFKDYRRRLAGYINFTTLQKAVFGPFYPLLSMIFLSLPRPLKDCGKPYIACLVLQKPSGDDKAVNAQKEAHKAEPKLR